MKPAPFEWRGPRSAEEAVATLAEVADDGKILAGGQSLVALMNLRLAAPAFLVDITGVEDLNYVRRNNGSVEIAAAVRQSEAEDSTELGANCPLLADALPLIAHREIRNAGTVCGSLAHADPAAELPAVALATGSEFVVRSVRGVRMVPAAELYVGYLTTTLEPDELVAAVRIPVAAPRSGSAFVEVSPRAGDYGIVGVAVSITLDSRDCLAEAALAYSGVDAVPVRGAPGEQVLIGNQASDELFADAARAATQDLAPQSDLNGTSDYRRHVAEVVTRRALHRAAARVAADG